MNADRPRFEFLDPVAGLASIGHWLAGEDVFVAVVVYTLACGHVRPMNVALETGEPLLCLACDEPAPIVSARRIPPTAYPSLASQVSVTFENPDTE